MNIKLLNFHPGELLRAVLAWIAETSEGSRSARLASLGLGASDRSPTWYDESSNAQRLR
ncbi:MAG: hypothetical protein IPQ01_00830 [Zoogloea sp.]|jgi:hypothetical protein|nr:hypothetical protein [Zoogloea sp.]MBP7394686.1 hypothetical protein [Zoogloea sp.]